MGVKVGAGGPGVPGHAPRKSWVLSWRLVSQTRGRWHPCFLRHLMMCKEIQKSQDKRDLPFLSSLESTSLNT